MALKDDLTAEVKNIFRSSWTDRDGTVVPDDSSVKLSNDAVKINAAVLYADMADSTILVDSYRNSFAAEIYKAFLHCAAKVIRSEDGVITAYDGDRIMAVFIGEFKNTRAVRTALKINWAVQEIIRPAKSAQYPDNNYTPKQVVGVDTSALYVAKTGVRGANDLVWVGRAANHAAKLSSLPEGYQTYISKQVFDVITDEVKFTNGKAMWETVRWNTFDGRIIYRSNWRWPIS